MYLIFLQKDRNFFQTVIFSNIINVFTVSFDQFNASLLNLCIISLSKNNFSLTLNFWTEVY